MKLLERLLADAINIGYCGGGKNRDIGMAMVDIVGKLD
jgi:hypothetical protein